MVRVDGWLRKTNYRIQLSNEHCKEDFHIVDGILNDSANQQVTCKTFDIKSSESKLII